MLHGHICSLSLTLLMSSHLPDLAIVFFLYTSLSLGFLCYLGFQHRFGLFIINSYFSIQLFHLYTPIPKLSCILFSNLLLKHPCHHVILLPKIVVVSYCIPLAVAPEYLLYQFSLIFSLLSSTQLPLKLSQFPHPIYVHSSGLFCLCLCCCPAQNVLFFSSSLFFLFKF